MVCMNRFVGQQQQLRGRHREQTGGHSGGGRELDEWREQHGNIYITTCEIDSQLEFAAQHDAL